MLIINKGQMVRTRVKEIRDGEKLQAIAPVVGEAEEDAQTAEESAEKS